MYYTEFEEVKKLPEFVTNALIWPTCANEIIT